MTIELKRNVPGFRDANGVFHPLRSASYIPSGKGRRKATTRDKKKYSRAKAGDLGKARQERALEDVFDREIRLEREAKAQLQKERDRIEREIAGDIYGETSGRTSRGKARSLAQFIRSAGGINTKFRLRRGQKQIGDLANYTLKDSGKRGLVTTTPGKGIGLDGMWQSAREAGYDVTSTDDMLARLDSEIAGGPVTYSTHGYMSYNPATYFAILGALDENGRPYMAAKTREYPTLAAVRKVLKSEVSDPIAWIVGGGTVTAWGITSKFRAIAAKYPIERAKSEIGLGRRNPAAKKNPDAITMFAGLAGGIASALSIKEHMERPIKRKPAKRRGTTTAKTKNRTNPAPSAKRSKGPKGDLYVLTIGSGDDLISVYLHDGNHDGFSKRFKTMAAAKAYATKSKVKLVNNPAAAKVNGIVSRAWARSRAKAEYARELRQTAAAERSRERRRKAEAKAKANPKAKKMTKAAAKSAAVAAGIDFDADFHLLRFSEGNLLADLAKKVGYRKPASGSGSLGRHFFYHLQKLKSNPRSANGKKAVARSAKANPRVIQLPVGFHWKKRQAAGGGDYFEITDPKGLIVGWGTTRTNALRTFKTYGVKAKAQSGFSKDRAKQIRDGARSIRLPARNPKSAIRPRRTFEMFQGRKATTAKAMPVSRHAPANLDQLGDLIEIKMAGGKVIKFNPRKFKLTAARGKLWIVGGPVAPGDGSVPVHVVNPVAEIDHVVYGTRKPHHGDHSYTHYIHKLGEESGKRPILCVDREGFPVIRGGNYKIEARGIVD